MSERNRALQILEARWRPAGDFRGATVQGLPIPIPIETDEPLYIGPGR